MLLRITFVATLLFGTTLIHTGCTVLVLGWLRSVARRHWALRNVVTRGAVIGGLVFLMSLAAYLESALWASFYVAVGALPDFGTAMYFSLVTFTTLGYGDVTLTEEWRLLAGFESANGIMMFGWTTALLVATANRLFFQSSEGAGGA